MEKLFQVPSERAQSPRGEREKEGERINRKNYFHMQLGEGSLCWGLVRGILKGPRRAPASSLSFIFSGLSAKTGDAAGGRDAREHGPAEWDPHPAMDKMYRQTRDLWMLPKNEPPLDSPFLCQQSHLCCHHTALPEDSVARQMWCGAPQGCQPSGRGPPFVPGGFHGVTYQPELAAATGRVQDAPKLIFLRQAGKHKG